MIHNSTSIMNHITQDKRLIPHKYDIEKINKINIVDNILYKNELTTLENISKDNIIPHTIFFGPPGTDIQTIISLFLKMIYNEEIYDLKEVTYSITGSGNSTTQLVVLQSNYHIVIDPNNNNFDKYLVQEIVKEYAKRMPLDVFTSKRTFKVVLINGIDNMSYYAQTSLRRTMEIYSNNCKFIMWGHSLSKVIEPLKSRCSCFRIEAPSSDDIFKTLLLISFKENIKLSLETMSQIMKLAKNNYKKALWMLELSKYTNKLQITYDKVMNKIYRTIIKHDLQLLLYIRELIYKITTTGFSGTIIIEYILNCFLESDYSDDVLANITKVAAKCEYDIIKGRREIIVLDVFVISIINILNGDAFE